MMTTQSLHPTLHRRPCSSMPAQRSGRWPRGGSPPPTPPLPPSARAAAWAGCCCGGRNLRSPGRPGPAKEMPTSGLTAVCAGEGGGWRPSARAVAPPRSGDAEAPPLPPAGAPLSPPVCARRGEGGRPAAAHRGGRRTARRRSRRRRRTSSCTARRSPPPRGAPPAPHTHPPAAANTQHAWRASTHTRTHPPPPPQSIYALVLYLSIILSLSFS